VGEAFTAAEMNEFISYNADTGELFWKVRRPNRHQTDRGLAVFNSKFPGKRVASKLDSRGYKVTSILGKHLMQHRIVWAINTGEWPDSDIDHINGDRSDNRMKNLRSVDRQENMRNKGLYKTNKAGVPGVSFHSRDKVWTAKISDNKRQVHLGYFDRMEDAISARIDAEMVYRYHENHGRKL